VPLDSPGARMKVGEPTFSRTRSYTVSQLGEAYSILVAVVAGSTQFSSVDVSDVLAWRTTVRVPSWVAPSVTRWIVMGRPPTGPNIWRRVRTSLTGRFTRCAAIAASASCDHAPPLLPKPPPVKYEMTFTFSGGMPKVFATVLRTEKIPCVDSYSVSMSPSQLAIVLWTSMAL
jgi:hypothetical protein